MLRSSKRLFCTVKPKCYYKVTEMSQLDDHDCRSIFSNNYNSRLDCISYRVDKMQSTLEDIKKLLEKIHLGDYNKN